MTTEPALTARAAREIDRRTIEELGLSSIVLMENAGRACADEVLRLPERGTGPVVVVAGPGNNGGDGFVIGRTLANLGAAVHVWFVGDRARLDAATGDFGTNAGLWRALGHETRCLDSAAELTALAHDLNRAGVVVDALFGTGLARDVAGLQAEVVRAINASSAPVVAVDIPSGLDCDTGQVLGVAVRATATVTFVATKVGFGVVLGPEHAGRVIVREIGVPASYLDGALK